ncbi:unnamed protein product [Parnassius mnemosyne]|uniref:Cuticle protein 6 n=1 Tax=Parnassius mnemosyne TaxID=213953 RepID=A0AAV1MCC6_9NEOP
MLRFVTLLAAVLYVSAAPNPISNVLKLDLDPDEAQNYINNPPYTEPQLVGRKAVLPLIRFDDPRFRSVEAGPTLGHYWRNGEEITNPEDYVEEIYDASQYHGQDGRGAYAYGYETPESAKVEDRAGSGKVKGSYTYKSGNDIIKVTYWADSEGFHQEDNLPKIELKPAEETEEVRAARLAHEKAWQEARAAALLSPQPQGEYEPSASEQQDSVVAAPSEAQSREGKALPAYGQQSYPQQSYPQPSSTTTTEEPEPTGPPRGFFYSFTYPVSIIVPKDSAQPEQNYNQDFRRA